MQYTTGKTAVDAVTAVVLLKKEKKKSFSE